MKYFLGLFLLLIAIPAQAASISPVSSLQSGDLIRGESFSAVYYFGEDGLRYVFPNDKTYFTWYTNFNNVKWLSDKNLATIQIGGNVTYKPGVKMIKINSDPKVYAVSTNGTLHPVVSESVAIALYGTNWNKKIDDVPDGFFSNYTIDAPIELASQYSVQAEQDDATSINADKHLEKPTIVSISDSGYTPPTITINSDTAVKFINTGTTNQSASEWDGMWGTGTLKPGQHFTRYFAEKGVWTYFSKYTPKTTMTGSIIVK